MATYDPVSTATALAENYVYARQARLESNSAAAQNKLTAVNSLKTALTTFTSALSTLSGKGGVVQQTTTVSNATAATATASSTASAGSYNFHVTALASAQQTLYTAQNLADGFGGGSSEIPVRSRFVVTLENGEFVAVDLANADADEDGKISVTEVARAINASSKGKVSASIVTQNGEQQLLINAGQTGEAGAFQVHLLADGEDVDSYVTGLNQGSGANQVSGKTLAAARNAEFVLGEKTGDPNTEFRISQSSNTYTGITGLSIEFKEVTTTTPLTVAVAKDESSTAANMQNFVSAYNTLVKSIDKLTASGNSENGVTAGALASDSGVRSLRSQLNTLLRSTIGGESLAAYGISSQRDGTIALDEKKFAQKVAANPEAIDALLGKTATLEYQRTGLFGKLQTYVNNWTSSTSGLLKNRQDNLQKLQTQYSKEQSTIDRMYEQAYQRYLLQFSTLASLEDQMSSTSSMLNSMLTSSNSNK